MTTKSPCTLRQTVLGPAPNQRERAALYYNFNYQTKPDRTQSVKMEEPY